jgi:hypothetical protein
MKIILAMLFSGSLLIGCNSVFPSTATFSPTRSVPSLTAPVPTSTPISRQNVISTPTEIQLPFNSNVSNDEYCKPPYAILPVSDGNDISEDEIVYELVKIWLRRYNQPNAPLFCRIEDYSIDKVYDDPSIYSNALEPRGDFMRIIVFSVKLSQLPSDWMSFAGELDQDNWLHVSHVVAISKTNEGYQMEFSNP